MDNVLAFVSNHWILISLFLIAFIWVIVEESRHQGMVGSVRQSPAGVTSLINRQDGIVVDLRDANVYKEGHIAGSINIPFNIIDQKKSKLESYKPRPIILVCALGQQSTQVLHKLRKQGVTDLYVLGGGIGAWKRDNLPLIKT